MSRLGRMNLAIAVTATIAASYLLGRHQSHSEAPSKTGRHVLYYIDPMHPSYKSDKPGVAPDCGMPLKPIFAEDIKDKLAPSSLAELSTGAVSIDGRTQRLLGIRVTTVERSSATRIVRVIGRVVPEDTLVYRINSGVDGFIRETLQDSVGTQVKKNQKLATYYSPEYLSVASGFLAASERVPGAAGGDGSRTMPFPGALSKQGVSSLQGYKDRLRNLGMSDVQIKRMADTGQLPESIDVVAPADGFILGRSISPGQHFDHGIEFYRIADLGRVWVIAEVYEHETLYLHPGGLAQITLREVGRQLPARITNSLPQSEAGGGTVKLRLEAQNPKFILRPEMLVDVELPVRLPPAVTVPVDAIVDSGTYARVYVEHEEGNFEPREVKTGWRFGEQVEILQGLQPGERVVVAATFLVDSESRLETPASGLSRTSTADAANAANNAASTDAPGDASCGVRVDMAKAAAVDNTLYPATQCKKKFQNNPSGVTGTH